MSGAGGANGAGGTNAGGSGAARKEGSERPRIGVIGVGLLGERHARFWAQQPDVELVGVADARRERAEEVAATWGAAVAAGSAEELIERARPDAVSVATPDFLHREPVVAALRAGLHVLCEKPLAKSTDDARAMIDAARVYGVVAALEAIHRSLESRRPERVAEPLPPTPSPRRGGGRGERSTAERTAR